MPISNIIARHYFSPPPGYFWHWSDDLEVLEWFDGSTLCYRADLENVLRGMTEANQSLPPLGAILLVIAACQENWKQADRMKDIKQWLSLERTDSLQNTMIVMAGKLLKTLGELPRELCTGQNRAHLLHELFAHHKRIQLQAEIAREVVASFFSGEVDSMLQTSRTAGSPPLSRSEIMAKARESRFRRMEQGSIMEEYIRKLPMDAPARFLEESRSLTIVWKKFYQEGSLEHHLRTGLGHPLPALPLELPEPEPPATDLLDDLARNPETAGIARLTRRLVAAFHIPRHAVGASDLPLGGVADITNRGDFDRLLLSELAQDDLLLMARLANNEAMFLRREEPPAQPERRRTLLIDTTLKMWGTHRPFALAVALACARQMTKGKVETKAFLLGDIGFETADLESKNGVIEALEHLTPDLHCGGGLSDFFAENPPGEDEDCFFISDVEAMQNADFQRTFAELRNRLRFIIAIRRDGGLEFYELVNGHRKLLSSARLDLGELLFGEKKKQGRKLPGRFPTEQLPKFFAQYSSPLNFPMTSTRIRPKNVFCGREYNAVVTDQRRLLLWRSFQEAATELSAGLLSDDYCLGENAVNQICVLMRDPKDNKLHMQVGPHLATHTWPLVFEGDLRMTFDFGKFFIFLQDKVFSIDPHEMMVTHHYDMEGFISVNFDRGRFNLAKRMANRGYSTLQHADHIYVGPNGKLVLGKYILRPSADRWRLNEFWKPGEQDKGARTEVFTLTSNPRVRLYRRVWHHGGEAIVDGRGLLHLRSADPNIPEVSLSLNLQKGIGMWASDGAYAGNTYFTRERMGHITRHDFYECYIKPILLGISDSQY